MAWYVDYFKDNYFLLEEPIVSEALKHHNFITSVEKLSDKSKILELGAGSGRLSLLLSKSGFDVTALELNDDILREAKRRAEKEDIKLTFVKDDMRNIRFEDEFDMVILWSHSFGYFNDQENHELLISIRKALKNKGRFLLDLSNRESIIHDYDMVQKSWIKKENEFLIFNRVMDPLTGRLDSKIFVTGDNICFREYVTSVRYYSYTEIKKELIRAGFKIHQVYGDYSLKPYTLGSSRMIIYAEKK